MNDELISELLVELTKTREAFESAVAQIKWNRRNTTIQYVLIGIVSIMMILGGTYYISDRRAACERGNDLRREVAASLQSTAASIGVALAIVTDAPDSALETYMNEYENQPKPEALVPREC